MYLLLVFALLGAFASPLSATGNHRDSASVSAKEVAPIPPVPTVSSFTYGGTGCPAGSVTSTLTPVNSTLGTYTLTHTLPAMALNGSVPVQSRKNCQFNVKIEVPKPWQYRINHDKFNVDKYVWLPDTLRKLNVKAWYYWSNDDYMSSAEIQPKGPHSGRFAAWGEDPYDSGTISECGGAMINISSQARITSEATEWPVYPGPVVTPGERVWTYTHSVRVVNERDCRSG